MATLTKFQQLKFQLGKHGILRQLFNYKREQKMLKLYYHDNPKNSYYNGIIFCVDVHIKHGGLADRFYGALCTFALCKIYGIDFKLHYTFPFELTTFLKPNRYDWSISKDLVVYNNKQAKPYVLLGDFDWYKRFKKITTLQHKQIHLYANVRVLDKINEFYGTTFTYKQLYEELFQLSENLQLNLKNIFKELPPRYNSLCFRFRNAFGDFKENNFLELSETEKIGLLQYAHKQMHALITEYNLPIVVTADSPSFLKSISNIENVYSVYQNKGGVHMDYTNNADKEIYKQSFIDYYALSKGENIFCCRGNHLDDSGFPYFAATIENKERKFFPTYLNDR